MSTTETKKIFEPVPEYLLEAFLQKFRLFTTNKEPDELMTTTQLFDVFDEHLGGVDPSDVSEVLKEKGFTVSFDNARMLFLWKLKMVEA
jgi:hypothetical protein